MGAGTALPLGGSRDSDGRGTESGARPGVGAGAAPSPAECGGEAQERDACTEGRGRGTTARRGTLGARETEVRAAPGVEVGRPPRTQVGHEGDWYTVSLRVPPDTRAPQLPPRVCQSPTPLTQEHHDPGRTQSTFPCAARERKISKLMGHRCPLQRLSSAGHSPHSCKMGERGVADHSDIGAGG